MTPRRSWLATVGVATLVASTLSAQSGAPRTTSDGIFTAEQVQRGRMVYRDSCVMCHGGELMGIEMAPPLAGPMFLGDWSGAAVGELFDRIAVSMPSDKPGTLTRQQVADVVALILSVNKSPAGQTELPREPEALRSIKIEAPPGR
jgi:mono/diheme cytochrome c family protein